MDGGDRPCVSYAKSRWYVLHIVKPPADILVLNILRHFGIEVYQFTELRKHKRRKPTRIALYPGYLFVCFDVFEQTWRTIHEIPGVIRLMSSGPETPTALPEGELEALIEQHRAGNLSPDKREKLDRLMAGAIMRVVEGPYSSFPAVVEKDHGDEVDASVTIFGRSMITRFKRSALVKV